MIFYTKAIDKNLEYYQELIETRKLVVCLERDVWHLRNKLKFMTVLYVILLVPCVIFS